MPYLHIIDLSGTKVKIPPELPKESKNRCRKRIFLADQTSYEGETWSQIKKDIQSQISDNTSSSFDVVVKSQEISEKKSGEITEIQSNKPSPSDCTDNRGISRGRFHQVPLNRDLYKKTLSFFYSASQQEALEINDMNDPGGFSYEDMDAIANAESVSFVDSSSARIASIFNQIKSVKACWLRMSLDIKCLFADVSVECLESLETLSISNFPSLETICWADRFKNLKKLSIDCCPKIRTLFPEASQMPSSLEVVHIKFCEKLEKVVEGVELSTLTNLTLKLQNCPNFMENSEGSDWITVDYSEASPSDSKIRQVVGARS